MSDYYQFEAISKQLTAIQASLSELVALMKVKAKRIRRLTRNEKLKREKLKPKRKLQKRKR